MILLDKIILTKVQLKILEKWAKECHPIEAPAILIGDIDEDKKVGIVSDVYPVKNIENSTVSFKVDPEEQYSIYKTAIDNNKKILGIFHSHPMDPVPSSIDLPYIKLHKNVWIIMSTTKKIENLKAYQWADNKINEVKIEIVE